MANFSNCFAFFTLLICVVVPIVNSAKLGLLRNVHYNTKCLRIKDGSSTNGALYELPDCDPNDPYQQIDIDRFPSPSAAPGTILFYILFPITGKCLSNDGFRDGNSVKLVQWTCKANGTNQQWKVVSGNTQGTFELQVQSVSRCLTASTNATIVDQWSCNDKTTHPWQAWTIEELPKNTSYPYVGLAILQNYYETDKCLRVKGRSHTNAIDYELVPCSCGDTYQHLRTSTGFSTTAFEQLIFNFDGKCVSNNGYEASNGKHVIQYDCGNGKNQNWKVVNGALSTPFQFKNEAVNKCLRSQAYGSFIDQFECGASTTTHPEQFWVMKDCGTYSPTEEHSGVFLFENLRYNYSCLTAAENTSGTSSKLNLTECESIFTSQLFNGQNIAGPDYSPISINKKDMCMDVYNRSLENDAQTWLYNCAANASNQEWIIEYDPNDPTRFQIKVEHSGKCLEASGPATMVQYNCKDYNCAPQQWWKLRKPLNRFGILRNVGINKCLKALNNRQDNSAEFYLEECDPNDKYQWIKSDAFENYNGTSIQLVLQISQKCVSNNGYAQGNGVHPVQWTCRGGSNQTWKLVNGNQTTQFHLEVDAVTGHCLTGGAGGSYVDQWDCDYNAAHQAWRIEHVF